MLEQRYSCDKGGDAVGHAFSTACCELPHLQGFLCLQRRTTRHIDQLLVLESQGCGLRCPTCSSVGFGLLAVPFCHMYVYLPYHSVTLWYLCVGRTCCPLDEVLVRLMSSLPLSLWGWAIPVFSWRTGTIPLHEACRAGLKMTGFQDAESVVCEIFLNQITVKLAVPTARGGTIPTKRNAPVQCNHDLSNARGVRNFFTF
jgi:hypothetical protein